MRDPKTEALLIAVREAVTEARRAGVTEMACLWDAAVAAVDKGAHGEPSPEARELADSIRRFMTPAPDPRETAPMRPEDVDGELVDDAVDVWHETPHLLLDDRMRAILAAVQPAARAGHRARLAEAEVERRCSCDGDPIECSHEAARGQAEAAIERVRALYDIHRERHPKPLWDCITCRMGVALGQPKPNGEQL